MLRTTISCLILLFSLNALAQTAPVEQSLKGTFYTIYPGNTGKKLKASDVMTFNFLQKTDKDSVLYSSFETKMPVTIQVQPSRNYADLMDIFLLLSEKDSVTIRLPTDSIFKSNEGARPPFLPTGSFLNFQIKVERVMSVEEAIEEREKEKAGLIAGSRKALQKYITDKGLTTQSTESGLQYIVTKAAAGVKPVAGDTVYVNYVGRTLNGNVFDTSIEEEAKNAKLEQPGRNYEPFSFVVGKQQVIQGWDEGLLLLNEGSKATLFIPSDLAYGEQGAGDDIMPYSPLVFDVELVKVRKPKNEPAAAPAAKPAAPAATKPAATPAKKPAATTPKPTAKPVAKPATTVKPAASKPAATKK